MKRKTLEEKLQESVAPKARPPKVGDIVQIIAKGHEFRARVGIIHSVHGERLICYSPGRGGFPHKWEAPLGDCEVCGKAILKFTKPLPVEHKEIEQAVVAVNALDRI